MSDQLRPNIFPAVRYRDADAGVAFLTSAFGAVERAVHRGPDGVIHHAELALGAGLVMVGQYSGDGWLGGEAPRPLSSTVSIYVVVDDPDRHRAVAARGRRQRGARARGHGLWVARVLGPRSRGQPVVVRDLRPLWGKRLSRRTRTLRYGASIAVALVGVACGALIPGTAGGTAATVLVGIGLVGVVSLVFYEVGLTEDRDRAREARRAMAARGSQQRPPGPRPAVTIRRGAHGSRIAGAASVGACADAFCRRAAARACDRPRGGGAAGARPRRPPRFPLPSSPGWCRREAEVIIS